MAPHDPTANPPKPSEPTPSFASPGLEARYIGEAPAVAPRLVDAERAFNEASAELEVATARWRKAADDLRLAQHNSLRGVESALDPTSAKPWDR